MREPKKAREGQRVVGGPDEHRDEHADGARAEYQDPVARVRVGGPGRAQGVAVWLRERAEHWVDEVGKGVQRKGRDRQPLGQRAGTSVADTGLLAAVAQVLVAVAGSGGMCRRRPWCPL